MSAACAGPEGPGPLCDHILAYLLEPTTQRADDVTAVVAQLFGDAAT